MPDAAPLISEVVLDACAILNNSVKELQKLTGYIRRGRNRARTKSGAYQIAQVYAYRGQSQESFTWLELADKQRDPGLPEINSDPLFRNLHDDPRYAELLKKMHLPI